MGTKLRGLMVALLAGVGVGLAQADGTFTFAPLPMVSPETVAGQWKPLFGHLERTLGIQLRIEYSQSYAEILEKFRAGKLDLAYLGPLPYVTLKDGFSAAVPLVHFNEMDGQPFYTCAVVALDERLHEKQALMNLTIVHRNCRHRRLARMLGQLTLIMLSVHG